MVIKLSHNMTNSCNAKVKARTINMKPMKEKISITIDGDVLEKIREKSEYYERSVSQFINIILKDYLEKFDNKDELKRVFTGR